jgi:hypothetical protein
MAFEKGKSRKEGKQNIAARRRKRRKSGAKELRRRQAGGKASFASIEKCS